MEYKFNGPDGIEKKWQNYWREKKVYKVSNESNKPKCYVLDMFPYPSGAGLHVGHPLGYIASDIYSRYKRLKGFNVLHPMGFDSFGLPAEQYAIETGQHPADTTEKNIATFKNQLDKIGFCYDWEREVRTSDPSFYKWTQWIFLQLFDSYFCNTQKKALPISLLIKKYETKGALPKSGEPIPGTHFTADKWNAFTRKQQEDILMKRRLAFCAYGEVNWCEALGTVLANDEVVNGVSERGGHPVEKKKMRQWYLRITAYADRLLEGLETVQFSDSMKEMQRNWIGKSQGAEMDFEIKGNDKKLRIYTTRPDTIYGVDFMVIAPEHELVDQITTADKKEEIEKYLHYVKSRSDRERMAEVKQITGCFTGAFAINPFNQNQIPIYIAEYVLAGYGTGAIMAVPCGDQRDFAFAKYFNIPITNIIGSHYNGEEANPTKEAVLENSGFLNGLLMKDAIDVANNKIEELGIGKRKINYRMRDAGFSRQRYWGEPFPIIWSDGIAITLDAEELPLELPFVEKYGPGPDGEGPLANIKEWTSSPSLLHSVEKGDGEIEAKTSTPSLLHGVEKGEVETEVKTSTPSLLHGVEKGDVETEVKTEAKNEADGDFSQSQTTKEQLQNNEFGYPSLRSGEGKGVRVVKYKAGSPMLYELAKQMRKDYTEAENHLWQELRGNKIGVKFRRQHPIESYIADFICLQHGLIVEVDGGYHETTEQKMYDDERTRILNEIGFKIIRFSNDHVLNNTEKVIFQIQEHLTPIPSPKMEKGDGEAEVKTSTPSLLHGVEKGDGETEAKNEADGNLSESQTNKEQLGDIEFSHPSPRSGEGKGVRETSTMPGYAGSSWYFLRYMDPSNNKTFCDRKASDYWNQVDLYIGGTEHAVGHLLYSRMWTKFLFDLGLISFDEPFKKLLNQGMIQGSSRFVYRLGLVLRDSSKPLFHSPILFSKKYYDAFQSKKLSPQELIKLAISNSSELKLYKEDELNWVTFGELHVDVKYVDGVELNIEEFKKSKGEEYYNASFIPEEDGKYICGSEVEKMSKSKYNTVNPDDLVDKYGADTFRMYEMFLGPVEASKPWDTKGIEGVHRFLRKLWRLFNDEVKGKLWNEEKATEAELKILHRTIKKIEQDTENFSFNTAVSAFMICVNELADIKCHKKEILQKVLILLVPYAPHISEELWHQLGNEGTILNADYPAFDAALLVESTKEYPVSINGKLRTNINLAVDLQQAEVEKIIKENEVVQKWLEGKEPQKIIYVKNKMINVVIK